MKKLSYKYSKILFENYEIIIAILSIVLGIFVFIFSKDVSLWARIIIGLLACIPVWLLLFQLSEEVLNLIIPEKFSKKLGLGLYVVKWKNREFDKFVGDDIISLRNDTYTLLNYFMPGGALDQQMIESKIYLSDYSFILLPLAKAYEGILKKILIAKNILTESYLIENPNINVSSYFNPVGNQRISEALSDSERDRAVPFFIYSVYQECRNQILHHDAHRDSRIKSHDEASARIIKIEEAITKAYSCFIKQI